MDGLSPVIPISKRLVPTDITTKYRTYVEAILERLAFLLRTLYNTTPERVFNIGYTRRIDGRNAEFSVVFNDVNGQEKIFSKASNNWQDILSPEEKELIVLYNKLSVIESEDWVRTIGRLSIDSVNQENQTFETSIKEVNMQDVLFLQYGYNLAIGNSTSFLPWRIVRQNFRIRPLSNTEAFIVPNTEGLSVNWIVDTMEVEYGAYRNMGMPFNGSNVVVYGSEIIRSSDPQFNEFANLLQRASNVFNQDTRSSIEQYQYKLGLQYDYLNSPDRTLETQLGDAAVNPDLVVVWIDSTQAQLALEEMEQSRREEMVIDLETKPVELLRRELVETIRRNTLILENDTAVLEDDLVELAELEQQSEDQWEPEQQNRAILLKREIQRLRSSVEETNRLIGEKQETLARLDSVGAFVQQEIEERELARRTLNNAVDSVRNTTIAVDNVPVYHDPGLGLILNGTNNMNMNQGQVVPVLVQSTNNNNMSEF